MLLITLLLSCAFQTQVAPLTHPFDGTWGGWVDFLGKTFWFQVRVRDDVLLIDDYNGRPYGEEALTFEVDEERVSFIYDSSIGQVSFIGEIEGRVLSGELRAEGQEPGRFEFTHFFDIAPQQLARHIGRYETDQGREFWVVPRSFGGVRVVEYEGDGNQFKDYWFDAWLPWKDDAYFEAVFNEPALPPRRSLVFDGDRMELRSDEGFVAHRVSGEVRPATFRTGDIALHGWLIVPPGDGPHPAIAYAHGSGYVSADSLYDLYTAVRMSRDMGVAVLRWDKRGVWNSGGDQALATYHDLAEDVLAAVDWLRAEDDIDPNMVGVGGGSQAPSWPLPIAAARTNNIAFVVAKSGSWTTSAETNIFSWTNQLRRAGFSEADVEEVKAFYRALFPYTVDPTPAGQDALDAFVAGHKDKSWFKEASRLGGVDTPLDLSEPKIKRWRRIWNVDPADYWRNVACPVFQVWGADDHLVDAQRSASRAAELVASTGQKNFTSIVYPSPTGHAVGEAPTFFDDLGRWFRKEVLQEP